MKLQHRRLLSLSLLLLACGPAPANPGPLPLAVFPLDTARTTRLGPAAWHRYLYSPRGPWAVHVLEAELGRCTALRAVKGAAGAVGRQRTSALLSGLAPRQRVIGGVNADFFLFEPPGVPAGALVVSGVVITGPSLQPVLALGRDRRPRLAVLRAAGSVTVGGRAFAVEGWNRSVAGGLALFDAGYGSETDTASGVIEVVLSGTKSARVVGVDTLTRGVAVPRPGAVLRAGREAPAPLRAALLGLRAGDPVQVAVGLLPFLPRESVGGRPLLLRDSLVADRVDTEGQPGFATGRHPRTAIGLARNGTRVLLVTVDGRQQPYSDGMTLRELAELLRALGARDALNLDGGGSTTLVYADPDSGDRLRVANRPSDAAGERPVGDALALIRTC